MKTLKTIVTLFYILIIVSCSSDGSDDSGGLSNNDSFIYKYENKNINITSWQAVKSENTIAVNGIASSGENFFITFNQYGNLSDVTILTGEKDEYGFSESYLSFEYFKSNYFNFELLGVDEDNKRVSVKFFGDLYEDGYDIDSETRYVEGSFNVEYSEVTPQIPGLEVSAKVDGNDWYSTGQDMTSGQVGTPVSINHFSDDAYTISYIIIPRDTDVGTYQFNENSVVNKISFSRYDPSTNSEILYETSGSFGIEEHTVGFGLTLITGTFSLTATNGDEVISVTNGKIKDVYSY
ncbi:MAG: hypothetical protein ABJL44_06360 [Algibacter sp.]